MLSIAAATANAPANAPAINRPAPFAGEQYHWRCHVLRKERRSRWPLTRASSSRVPCIPMALKKSESREASSTSAAGDDDDDSVFSLLTAVTSRYNEIVVLDTPKARFLLLDSSHNIHSILYKEQKWTGSYWDEFASLPAIVPQGPIAILGLGAGTAAHLMLDLWPSCHIEGWEIDEILINVAREYFALSDLESCTQAGGSLSIHIGDAFSPAAAVEGGFAGIVVDLFSGGKILPKLLEVATWLEIEKKLMPHGRIMVNCGGAHAESHAEIADSGYIKLNESKSSKGSWVQNSTIKAMCRAFPGKLSWKRMENGVSENYLALTGLLPDLDGWSASLPHPLNMNVKHWRPCELYG